MTNIYTISLGIDGDDIIIRWNVEIDKGDAITTNKCLRRIIDFMSRDGFECLLQRAAHEGKDIDILIEDDYGYESVTNYDPADDPDELPILFFTAVFGRCLEELIKKSCKERLLFN